MNTTVTKDDLEKIWQKWDKFEKPSDSEDRAWKLVEKTCLNIRDMIFLMGQTYVHKAKELEEKEGEITLPSFLLCYYIGLEVASGEITNDDSNDYLIAATKPIENFIMDITEILVTSNLTSLEEGRKRL